MNNPLFSLLSSIIYFIFPSFLYINNILLYVFYILFVSIHGIGFNLYICSLEIFIILFFTINHYINNDISNEINEKSYLLNIFHSLSIGISIFNNSDNCVYCNSTLEDFYNKNINSYSDLCAMDNRVINFLLKKTPGTEEFLVSDRFLRITISIYNQYLVVMISDITHKENKLHLYNNLVELLNSINTPLEIRENTNLVFQNTLAQQMKNNHYNKQLIKEIKEISYWKYTSSNHISDLCEIAPMGIIIINRELIIQQVNQHMQNMLKTTSVTLHNLLIEKDRKIFLDYIQGFMDGNITTASTFILRTNIPVTIKMKKYNNLFAIFVMYDPLLSNININYNHQQRLYLLGETTSCISHDFNNIITSILGFCDISLDECNQNTSIYKNLIHIRHHASRASNLVRQILHMSHKNTNELNVLKVKSSINEFLVTLGRVFVDNINVEHESNLNDNVTIEMSIINFEQILCNIIKNARDSIISRNITGKITIKSDLYRCNRTGTINNFIVYSGDYVKITIEDNGIGMNNTTLNSIFQPHFTTKKNGNGLGLYNIFNIITRNRGFVKIDSKVNVGTIIQIYIPTSHSKKNKITKDLDVDIVKNKILLVEDEDAIGLFTTKGLKKLGYDIETVNNINDAKKQSRLKHYDILITDINLPNGNGISLYKELKEENNKLQVIFISGYDTETIKSKYNIKSHESLNILNKPFYINDIHILLQSIMEKPDRI